MVSSDKGVRSIESRMIRAKRNNSTYERIQHTHSNTECLRGRCRTIVFEELKNTPVFLQYCGECGAVLHKLYHSRIYTRRKDTIRTQHRIEASILEPTVHQCDELHDQNILSDIISTLENKAVTFLLLVLVPDKIQLCASSCVLMYCSFQIDSNAASSGDFTSRYSGKHVRFSFESNPTLGLRSDSSSSFETVGRKTFKCCAGLSQSEFKFTRTRDRTKTFCGLKSSSSDFSLIDSTLEDRRLLRCTFCCEFVEDLLRSFFFNDDDFLSSGGECVSTPYL